MLKNTKADKKYHEKENIFDDYIAACENYIIANKIHLKPFQGLYTVSIETKGSLNFLVR